MSGFAGPGEFLGIAAGDKQTTEKHHRNTPSVPDCRA
jgi:hypothetical protein